MQYGDTVELADSQIEGLLLPERAIHRMPAGLYVVTDWHTPVLRCVTNGQAWEVSEVNILAVTAEVNRHHRSYRPLSGPAYHGVVTITVEAGCVQEVSAPPGVRVVVKDYDIQDDDDERVKRDENGDSYLEVIHEGK